MRRSHVLCLMAAFCLPGVASADTLDDIRSRGVIRVAIPQDSPPFGSVGVDMSPRGYDVDIAKALAADLGVRVEMTPVSSSNRLPYLQLRKVDMIIYSLGKSPEREQVLDFSQPYAMIFSGVFGGPAVKVSTPADLAGKTIGVTRGSLEDMELVKLAPEKANIKRFEDSATTMASYVSSQVQLTASANTSVAALIARNPRIPMELKFKIKTSPAYIGVSKGEHRLLEHVNKFISARKQSGELDALYKKWFGMPLPELSQ